MSSIFDFDKRPDPYAVMGNPISHSRSPQIHRMFAQQTGQNILYEAIQVDPGGFKQAVGNFVANGGKGLNITVPFKEDAWRLMDKCNPRAVQAAAVNTIIIGANHELIGDNTDGVGLVRDLQQNHSIQLAGKSLLMLGAGGAARGVLHPLLESGLSRILIANRTASRAYELAERFSDLGNVSGAGFEEIPDRAFDLIINASASSLQGDLPPLPSGVVNNKTDCYDMMYGSEPTNFQRWCSARGAALTLNGLGMLVEQAAESFYLWRGVHPDTKPVISAIAANL